MATRDRQYLGDGIAIQRRGNIWCLDIYRTGERFRRSLGTPDVGEALMKANAVRKELEIKKGLIGITAWLAAVPELEKREEIWQCLLKKGSWKGPDPRVHNPLIEALGDLALKGVRLETKDALLESLMRKVVREEAHAPAPSTATPWPDGLAKFEKSKTRKVTPDSLKNILRDIREFVAFAKTANVEDTTPAQIDEWVSALLKRGCSPKTAWNKRANLSSFFEWARRVQRIVATNPVSATEPPKLNPLDPERLTREEALHRMNQWKDHPMIWVAGISLYCGLRLGEMERLDSSDIDIAGRNIRVKNTEEGGTKTGKQRNVPILDQALPYLRMLPTSGKIFPWNTDNVSKVTNKLGLGNLLLRHTLETHLRMNSVEPQAIGDHWLGHNGKTGARHYAGTWRRSEIALTLTYYGLPLTRTGIPEVPEAIRVAYKALS